MKNYLVMFILLVLLTTSAYAMTATLLSGMIQINLEKVPSTFQKSIGIKNENNQTVDVKFMPSDDLKDMVTMETYNISLQPGEQRFVKFNLTATEMKELRSDIKMVFSIPGSNLTEDNFGLATKIVILPKVEKNSSNTDNTTSNISASQNQTAGENSTTPGTQVTPAKPTYWAYGIAGLALLLVAAFIILKIKAGAKNE
jgi:hypothetical protein